MNGESSRTSASGSGLNGRVHGRGRRRLARSCVAVVAGVALIGAAGVGGGLDGPALRTRVVGSQGVFLVYDALTPRDNPRDSAGYLAYWNDHASRSVYYFDGLVLSPPDVGRALVALERDMGVDLESIVFSSELSRLIEGARREGPPRPRDFSPRRDTLPRWRALTYAGAMAAMGFDVGTVADDPPPVPDEVPCDPPPMESVKPADRHTRSERAAGIARASVAAPPVVSTPQQRIDQAMAAVGCSPGGDGGGGNPCAGVNCNDGNPCTVDSCFSGVCHHVASSDACCGSSAASTALAAMSEALTTLVDAEAALGSVDASEPSVTVLASSTQAVFAIQIADASGLHRQGTATVTGCQPDGGVGLLVALSNDDGVNGATRWWTLQLTAFTWSDVLTMTGSLVIDDVPAGSTTLQGGWSYAPASGPLEDPNSDPGFTVGVIEMFNITSPPEAGSVAGFSLGSLLQMAGNILQLGINYLLDLTIPYTPPTSCLGPSISSSSCGGTVPCSNKLKGLCEKLDDLPGVDTSFKKCMKGRCGCGGSFFARLQVTCATSPDCGPCGAAGGCSLFGSRIWFCEPNSGPCRCADTVFHEMSHACGVGHSIEYNLNPSCSIPNEEACRIGHWFRDQCPPVGSSQDDAP